MAKTNTVQFRTTISFLSDTIVLSVFYFKLVNLCLALNETPAVFIQFQRKLRIETDVGIFNICFLFVAFAWSIKCMV